MRWNTSWAARPPAIHQRRRVLRLERLEDRCLLSAELVRDINPGPASTNLSTLTTANDRLYFKVPVDWLRSAGWRSDGTEAGTVQVIGSRPDLINVAGFTYYSRITAVPPPPFPIRNRYEVIRTDGVNEAQIWSYGPGPRFGFFNLFDVNGALFFRFSLNGNLYRYTPQQGVSLFFSGGVGQLTDVNGRLFFTHSDAARGGELWTTNGMVMDINPGPASSDPSGLVNVGGLLWFSADDGVHGRELWVSDGTALGTYMVADIRPGPEGSHPQNIIAGEVYYPLFSADDGEHGRELWMCCWDGITPSMIADINPGPASSDPQDLTDVSGYLFFTADTPAYGRELWFSDWTPDGTYIVKDIRPGPLGSNPGSLASLSGYLVYFAADDGTRGRELWVSDWSTDGTVLDTDIYAGATGSDPSWLVEMNGYVYFAATHPASGRELWRATPGRGPGGGRAPGGGASFDIALLQGGAGVRVWPVAAPSEQRPERLEALPPEVEWPGAAAGAVPLRDGRDRLFAEDRADLPGLGVLDLPHWWETWW